MTPRRAALWVGLAGLVVFGQTLWAGFVWDDLLLIVRNELLAQPGAWWRSLTQYFWDTSESLDTVAYYWRPVVKLSQALLFDVADGAPWPFHVFNVAMHVVTSVLALTWLRRRLGAEATSAALAGALLFALHPSRFETVPWASCATELCFAVFALLAALALENPKPKWAGLVALSLAVFSKETAFVLPVLFAVDAWLRGHWASRRPWLLLSPLAVAVPLIARALLGLKFPAPLATPALADVLRRFLGAFTAYHQRTLIPTEVTVVPAPTPELAPGVFDVPVWSLLVGSVLLIAWAAFAMAALRKPQLRPWLADALWWLVPLLPVLQLVTLNSALLMSDRYLYFALLGASALLARTFLALGETALWRAWLGLGGLLAASALMMTLALPAYRSNEAFFEREFQLHPDDSFTAEAFARSLRSRSDAYAIQRIIEGRLPDGHSGRRRQMTVCYVLARAETTRDVDTAALQELSKVFTDLIEGRATTVRVGDENVSLSAGDAVLAINDFDGADVRATQALLLARLGDAGPLVKSRTEKRLAHPSQLASMQLAAALIFQDRWAEAADVLARDEAQFPALAEIPDARELRDVAALGAADSFEVARRRAVLYARLGSASRGRKQLEPWLVSHAGSMPLIDARVQVEIDDRNFDAAVQILEAARVARPAENALNEALGEVQHAKTAWEQDLTRQLELATPQR